MKIAVQTSRLPGQSLAEQFSNAKRFGFDAVEISVGISADLAAKRGEVPLPFGRAFDVNGNVDEVKSAIVASGVPVCALCTNPTHDPLVPDPAEREKRFAALAELLAVCDEIGAGGVVSVPVRPPLQFPDMRDRDTELFELAVTEFTRWSSQLPAGNSAVFLEPLNRYEAYFLRRVEQATELAERVNHSRVLALADLFHMNIEESDLGKPIERAGSRLGHVHVADNTRFEPGQGCLDFKTPFQALKHIGYTGYISIECSRLSGDPEIALPAAARFLRDQWQAA